MNKLKRGIAFLLVFALVAVCIPQIALALSPEEIQKLEELEKLKKELEAVEKEIKELKDEVDKMIRKYPYLTIQSIGWKPTAAQKKVIEKFHELGDKLKAKEKERDELLKEIEKKKKELAELGTPAPGTATKLTAKDPEGRTWTVEALDSAPEALNNADELRVEKNAKGNYVAKIFKGGAEIGSKGLLWVYQPIPAGVTAAHIKVDGVETTFYTVDGCWKYAAEFKK